MAWDWGSCVIGIFLGANFGLVVAAWALSRKMNGGRDYNEQGPSV
jgi:hypothetical protein